MSWTKEVMKTAVSCIKTKVIAINKASHFYNIPRWTLTDYIGRNEEITAKLKVGQKPLLTAKEKKN